MSTEGIEKNSIDAPNVEKEKENIYPSQPTTTLDKVRSNILKKVGEALEPMKIEDPERYGKTIYDYGFSTVASAINKQSDEVIFREFYVKATPLDSSPVVYNQDMVFPDSETSVAVCNAVKKCYLEEPEPIRKVINVNGAVIQRRFGYLVRVSFSLNTSINDVTNVVATF